jgi:hypothetical protein
MTDTELASCLKLLLAGSYPDLRVEVARDPDDPNKQTVTFVDESFGELYPLQRYHRLVHLIPEDFYNAHLAESIWHECTPGENPSDLKYPDDELIEAISPDVMRILEKSGFFHLLDDRMMQFSEEHGQNSCRSDFFASKRILRELGRPEDDIFDVLHVLMAKGAFCDCEVLLNVVPDSNFRRTYWEGTRPNKRL